MSLADQIRAQAAISARPGQLEALEAIADRVAELEAWKANAEITLAEDKPNRGRVRYVTKWQEVTE